MAVAGKFKYASFAALGVSILATLPATAAPRRPPSSAAPQVLELVNSCRAHLLAATRRFGSVRATVYPAGPAVHNPDGSLTRHIDARIEYTTSGGIEVRRARVACQLDPAGQVMAIRPLRRATASQSGEAIPVANSLKIVDREKPPVNYERAAEALGRRSAGAVTKPREPVTNLEPVADPKPVARTIEAHIPIPPARPQLGPVASSTTLKRFERSVAVETGEESDPVAGAPTRAERRVFIHFPAMDNDARRRARQLADGLESRGFTVAKLRAVGFPISRSSVRYFHDQDRSEAAPLHMAVSRHLRDGASMQDFRHFGPSPRPGTMEVWVAN